MNEKEIVLAVDDMRRAQKRYFMIRIAANLDAMRDKEDAVRAILAKKQVFSVKVTEILDVARAMLEYQQGWINARNLATRFAVDMEKTGNGPDAQLRLQNLQAQERKLETNCKRLEGKLDELLARYYRPVLPGLE